MNIDILSILIPLLVAIPSLITFFRINQTKIVYIEKQELNFKDDLLKNFDELSIKYRNVKIQSNIYFISGFLVCQGNNDIISNKNNIEINVPNDSKWLDFKIVSHSKGMKLDRKIDKNRVELNFDLFKSKEYLEYEGIIEVDEKNRFNKINTLLNFHHRIPDIPKIIKLNIGALKSSFMNLIVFSLCLIFPIYVAYSYNNILSIEITPFNANTDKELNIYAIQNYDLLETLQELNNEVVNEYSGFEILFKGKTETFPVEITDYKGEINSELTSIYFKTDSLNFFDWVFAVLFLIMFVVSLNATLNSIKQFYYQKRFLSLIEK